MNASLVMQLMGMIVLAFHSVSTSVVAAVGAAQNIVTTMALVVEPRYEIFGIINCFSREQCQT